MHKASFLKQDKNEATTCALTVFASSSRPSCLLSAPKKTASTTWLGRKTSVYAGTESKGAESHRELYGQAPRLDRMFKEHLDRSGPHSVIFYSLVPEEVAVPEFVPEISILNRLRVRFLYPLEAGDGAEHCKMTGHWIV